MHVAPRVPLSAPLSVHWCTTSGMTVTGTLELVAFDTVDVKKADPAGHPFDLSL